jgi:hypothetical protein
MSNAGVVIPTLRIQTVVHRQTVAALYRLSASLDRAVELAKEARVIHDATLHIGDTTGIPVLDPGQLKRLRATSFMRLNYRPLSSGLGRGAAQNKLAEGAVEQLLMIIDPHATADPRLVIELVAPLAHPEIGIVEARQLPFESPKEWDSRTGETSFASLGCALIRCAVLREIGQFDESLPANCHEVDFSWRARLAGYRVVHRPSARVFLDRRLGRDGAPIMDRAEKRLAALGRLMLARKYGGPDLAATVIGSLSHEDEDVKGAVAEFRKQSDDTNSPDPLDPGGRVVKLVNGNFIQHRF